MSELEVAAQRGEQIYKEKYQTQYERDYPAQYVAIDLGSEQAFVGVTPEDALQAAQLANKLGRFHLIKIGSPGVYKVGFSSRGKTSGDWVFRL